MKSFNCYNCNADLFSVRNYKSLSTLSSRAANFSYFFDLQRAIYCVVLTFTTANKSFRVFVFLFGNVIFMTMVYFFPLEQWQVMVMVFAFISLIALGTETRSIFMCSILLHLLDGTLTISTSALEIQINFQRKG